MNLFSDIRFAFRLLIKNPGSSAMAILVMAVGTGVAITMFAFVNGVLWSSLGLGQEKEIYKIEWAEGDSVRNMKDINPEDFEAFQKEATSFEHLVTSGGKPSSGTFYNPSGNAMAVEVTFSRVSMDFFEALGERMPMGRAFVPEDVVGSEDSAVILSHALWQAQFGGDENVVGSLVMVNGRPHTVVGVARPGFRFPDKRDIWIATAFPREKGVGRTDWYKAEVLGVLKEGVSVAQAESELAIIASRLAQEYPATNENLLALNIKPFARAYAGDSLTYISYALLGCSFLVLGVACANVFNLIMTRTGSRTTELSIRAALGARRAHIVFQVVLDGLILTTLGAVGGALIAGWGLKIIWSYFEQGFAGGEAPYWWHMNLDGSVLFFVVGLVLISSLASSLIPGLRASRSSTAENLKDDSRTSSGLFIGMLSRIVLGFQITATGVLAFVSIMMLVLWLHLKERKAPIDAGSILHGSISFSADSENDALLESVERLRERIGTNPLVEGTAAFLPDYLFSGRIRRFEVEGEVYDSPDSKPRIQPSATSVGMEGAFGIEPLVGRGFTEFDTKDSQWVCIVNKSFVDYYWPNEDPIGKRIKVLGFNGFGTEYRTVVGVMPNVLPPPLPGEDLVESYHLKVIAPLTQNEAGSRIHLFIRSQGDPLQLVEFVRRELKAIGPEFAFVNPQTVEARMDSSLVSQKLIFSMFSVFGAASLILGIVGLYAVMSFTTRQRFREFGIRMALGADAKEIMITVVKRGAVLLVAGGTIGVAVGHVASLYLQRAIDLPNLPLGMTYPLVIAILTLATAISMGIPAWRASRISPNQALRVD